MEIDVLAYHDMEELDFAGPYEVFGRLAESESGSVYTVAHSQSVTCRHGMVIQRTKLLDEPPGQILVVPGGKGARTPSKEQTTLIKYISKYYSSREYVLSVCTGAFLLAEAGIITEKTVTTHRSYLSQLKGRVADYRIVKDGNVITCQGVSSGIDGALFLGSILFGKAAVERTIESIEYPVSIDDIYDSAYIVE
ncbi:MAG: DJ-1/PfpI family protein [Candidatus Methanofastidiosia archaeon]|jgi:transcriptional regulator GlxA family with amidase domain